MINNSSSVWDNTLPNQLSQVMANITDEEVMRSFLRDVMTEKEITEIAARFEAAKMLSDGKKYTEIIQKTKLSSRTVARISEWLQDGCNGYAQAISTTHPDHILPARA